MRVGTQVRERESGFRYTPTTCFETFPFPWPPGREPSGDSRLEAVAAAARELDDLRERWLNPPEWVREEMLEFPGSVDGPWSRWIHDANQSGIGTARWPRLVPRDAECAARLKKRTLTNLYNQRPTWLDLAHRKSRRGRIRLLRLATRSNRRPASQALARTQSRTRRQER